MFRKFGFLIVKGLLTILPIVLTVYFIAWIAVTMEATLSPVLPEAVYFPGLGIFTTIIFLCIVGLAVNAYVIKSMISYSKGVIENVPVIKTLYGVIQDAVQLFEVKKEQGNKKAVAVELHDGAHTIGFVTNDTIGEYVFPGQNKIAVYMPMSYQIGGYTLYVDTSKVTDLDLDVETAMRIAVTGGTSVKSDIVEEITG